MRVFQSIFLAALVILLSSASALAEGYMCEAEATCLDETMVRGSAMGETEEEAQQESLQAAANQCTNGSITKVELLFCLPDIAEELQIGL